MATVMNKAECHTGTRNEHFDLISVMYHSLEGAAVYEQYIQDANASGDRDLANFFQEVKDTNCKLADRAKELFAQRISKS
ncbi:hypothetical protein Nos7524_1697 [Nostoc sp. PCC 7524]|uniref:hypothetical protein n=1 Tax=Nostoc sp. (strain ATCC 29411 / PCC 7524) TaxID=28072 RepID=UPI00029F2D7C|nr:hypothetical protein [Nostoc sp. PCC 7524]AFY47569.1 hypothetical protein Nos7524_1697 [Nostoc sp. PCC 7524]